MIYLTDTCCEERHRGVLANDASVSEYLLTVFTSSGPEFFQYSLTKKRNKMGPELLNAILVTKSSMVAKNEDCRNKPISAEHYNLHNALMYAFKDM